jgi:hypothetical protein
MYKINADGRFRAIIALSVPLSCHFLAAAAPARATECDRVEVLLISSSQPGLREPGDPFNIFDGPDDHAIYYSAADWIRNPEEGLFLDGLVDLNFGMSFGNVGPQPEGFDQQVKQLQEYRLGPAYAAGVTADNLQSATLQIIVDAVLDMTLSGQTDLITPQWMYVNVFVGDELLTTLEDAQLDFDRCDRARPDTWEIQYELLTAGGGRITADEIDAAGGKIVLNIDVTEQVRELMAESPSAAGFTLAASADGDFVLMSVDGGSGSTARLPRLLVVGGYIGDFDGTGAVDLVDFAVFQGCFSGEEAPAEGCAVADLDRDGDVDTGDLTLLADNLRGPGVPCTDEADSATYMASTIFQPLDPSVDEVPAPRFFGDFNDDGELNHADRLYFESCYESAASGGGSVADACLTADLNHDGRVDARDRRLFVAIFGE